MEKAIDTIKQYARKCIDCTKHIDKNCKFLLYEGTIPSIENSPFCDKYIASQYCENRAILYAEKRGEPCSSQKRVQHFFNTLDDVLDTSSIPNKSTELISVIRKISSTKNLLNNSDLIFHTFRDVILASIDKCIARIDLHYLENKINLIHVIQAIYSDYSRSFALKSLFNCFNRDIIDTYVDSSIVLEFNDLINNNEDITHIARRIEARNEEEGALEYELRCSGYPGFRQLKCSATKEIMSIFEDIGIYNIIISQLCAFGYHEIFNKEYNGENFIEEADFIINIALDKHFGIFNRWSDLQKEIETSLIRNISDRKQTLDYISSIVKPTEKYSILFYPNNTASLKEKEAATLLKLLGSAKAESYKSIINVWQFAKTKAKERLLADKLSEDKYIDVLYRIAADKAQEEWVDCGYNELTVINSLITNMKNLEICISGCLIMVGWGKYYADLHDIIGIKLSDCINNSEITNLFKWDKTYLQECINNSKKFLVVEERSSKDDDHISNNTTHQIVETVDLSMFPSTMCAIIEQANDVYSIIDGKRFFKGNTIKEYALWLREVYRAVYKKRDDRFKVQWAKVPIFPMLKKNANPKSLSNSIRYTDNQMDVVAIEKYKGIISRILEKQQN